MHGYSHGGVIHHRKVGHITHHTHQLIGLGRVRFEILDPYKRPVSATADAHEVRNVLSVDIHQEQRIRLKLMFDPDHSLEDRILDEQFL